MTADTLARIRADLESLIDATNDVENTAPHASAKSRAAYRRGNALRTALRALQSFEEDELDVPDGYDVRHDMHGFYYCTAEEADHEDAGNPSAGFDGRPHFPTIEEAALAAHKAAELE